MSQNRFFSRNYINGFRGVLLGFCLVGGLVSRAQSDAGRFKVPDIDENGVLKSLMTGESARMFLDKPMEIQELKIEFYELDGKTVKIVITSPFCKYDTRANTATSDAKVEIKGRGFHIEGVGYIFEAARSQMQIRSEVKVVFKNMNLKPPQPKPEVTP